MTVFAPRQIRKSVRKNLSDLFEDVTKWLTPFNVYDDDDMKAGTTPTRPAIYILDFGNLFETKHLPAVVVNPGFQHHPGELGNRWSRCNLELSCFGRTLDEADDVAGAIMNNLTSWSIYSWTTGTSVLQGTTQNDTEWMMEYVPVGTEFEREGTFDNWVAISCGFPVPYFT